MLTEAAAFIPGFTSYFSFSRLRSGYSGVATYCRDSATPTGADTSLAGSVQNITGSQESSLTGASCDITPGLSCLREEFSSEELRSLDNEGRCVITRHRVRGDTGDLVVINVYCPRADPEKLDRVRFKQRFNKALDIRANRLREAGNLVVVCGDINISHKEIDHCDPYDGFEDNPGRRFLNHFLKPRKDPNNDTSDDNEILNDTDYIEEWVTSNVSIPSRQFVDTFRIFHPDRERAYTCWNTEMNCRSTNYGTRIDYILASLNMTSILLDCDLKTEVLGSDHCPVLATFRLELQPPAKPPDTCTKYYREFSGKQVKLSNFFNKAEKRSSPEERSLSSPSKKRKVDGKAKITSFFTSQNPKPATKDVVPGEMKTLIDVNAPIEQISVMQKLTKQTEKQKVTNQSAKAAWGSLLRGPAPAPLCPR